MINPNERNELTVIRVSTEQTRSLLKKYKLVEKRVKVNNIRTNKHESLFNYYPISK